DPGSQVKVLALNRVPGDGIQVSVEQTLGRSWSAVQKLKTPDSKFEIKTPSTTAVVRGTAFLTLVQQLPTGGTQTTYQVDDGTLQVTAIAGGTVAVPAGTQVTIAEGAPAPANVTPISPSPRLAHPPRERSDPERYHPHRRTIPLAFSIRGHDAGEQRVRGDRARPHLRERDARHPARGGADVRPRQPQHPRLGDLHGGRAQP